MFSTVHWLPRVVHDACVGGKDLNPVSVWTNEQGINDNVVCGPSLAAKAVTFRYG